MNEEKNENENEPTASEVLEKSGFDFRLKSCFGRGKKPIIEHSRHPQKRIEEAAKELKIDTDDLDNMSRRDLVELLEAYNGLREENEQLRKADWEYECLWTWLDENTNLLNTIEPLMEEWKKEMI